MSASGPSCVKTQTDSGTWVSRNECLYVCLGSGADPFDLSKNTANALERDVALRAFSGDHESELNG